VAITWCGAVIMCPDWRAGWFDMGRSSSVGGYGEMFGGAKSGSAPSSSFVEFLEGSLGKSTGRSADGPYSEDIPAVFYQGRSRAAEQPGQSASEQGTQGGILV
jgi:hypothetical protein